MSRVQEILLYVITCKMVMIDRNFSEERRPTSPSSERGSDRSSRRGWYRGSRGRGRGWGWRGGWRGSRVEDGEAGAEQQLMTGNTCIALCQCC